MTTSAYKIIGRIVEDSQVAVYKVYRKKNTDRLPTLKILKADILLTYQKAQFRQNIETQGLKCRISDDTFSLGAINSGYAFIPQDCVDGVALDKLIETSHKRPAYDAEGGHK